MIEANPNILVVLRSINGLHFLAKNNQEKKPLVFETHLVWARCTQQQRPQTHKTKINSVLGIKQ